MIGWTLEKVPGGIFQVGCGPSVSGCDKLAIDFHVLGNGA